MHYLKFLKALHEMLNPAVYFEIGIRRGASLTLARKMAIGVDPSYQIEHALSEDNHLFRQTSDDFFAGAKLRDLLGANRHVDLAFIDGWHNFEFALRDFMNTERHSQQSTVFVFDDVKPRTELEAVRVPHGGAWTGDIWKVGECLRKYRPDLNLMFVGTQPTGLLVVQNPNPKSEVLTNSYEAIEAEFLRESFPLMPSKAYLDAFISPSLALDALRDKVQGK
jgi:hypothetical protein